MPSATDHPTPPALSLQLLRDRTWRLGNLYSIVDDQARLIPFRPNHGQRQFYRDMHLCNHVLKARKLGFSTFIELLNLDELLCMPNLTAGIVDKSLEDARRKLHMMRVAYQNLDNRDLHPHTWKLGHILKDHTRLVTDTRDMLVWSNGSMAYCGTSLRGGTTNRLHISELGAIAVKFPVKAREIVEGALNSFTPGNRADIESTHEGGRLGIHYDLLRRAMAADPARLTPVDFKFHFYPWYRDPRYTLGEAFPVKPHTRAYFEKLSAELGEAFTHGQMLWYERKADTQAFGMKKEFPSTPGEAFEAISHGAIYGTEMANLRANRRICDFAPEANYPIYSFWDLGLSDYGAMWLIQPLERTILVLDWFETEGRSAAFFADQIRRWEIKWGRPIARHFLPHDATTRDRGTGKSYVHCLQDAGLGNVTVVPRTPDIWLGVGHVRDLLPHCWFHSGNCDTSRNREGGTYTGSEREEEFPSGVACLEGYSRQISTRQLREAPRHDQFSHTADAFRTFAEARRAHLLDGQENKAKPRALR